jgi:hypothetical protein
MGLKNCPSAGMKRWMVVSDESELCAAVRENGTTQYNVRFA